jgi:hypothetical protein
MGCVCIQKLGTAVENLKKLPLAALADLIPSDLPTARMGQLSTALMSSAHAHVSATARAHAQLMARLAASAKLSASLNMSVVADLEAMAHMQQAFGVSPLSANASARLRLAITSMNANLPPLLAVLLDQLAPLAEKLAALAAALSTSTVVNQTLGLNLAQPGAVAKLQAALQATATASASVTASSTATVSANATMNLAAHMRLVAAARALGINLLTPGGIAKLSAAISASARLGLPALAVNPGQMGALASALGQISAAQTALNVKLAVPNAASLLAAALGPLLEGVSMAARLDLVAKAAASASASASAQAALAASQSASAQATVRALASVDLRGLALPALPNFGNLSLAATLTEQLSAATGVAPMQNHPCSSCPVAGAF